jgi:periplasmic divalent cation tolerance protein
LTGALVCLSTVARPEDAERIARELVERGLAACVSVVPGLVSFYRWQGRVEREGELLLLIKTPSSRLAALKDALPGLHPYDVPELVALEVADGHAPYLEWLAAGAAGASPG